MAANHLVRHSRCPLLRGLLTNVPNWLPRILPSTALIIPKRWGTIDPVIRIPIKHRKLLEQGRKDRQEVYFRGSKPPLTHSLADTMDCLRAYSLFGPEDIDIILSVDMGDKETRVHNLRGLLHLPKSVSLEEQVILVFAEGDVAEAAKAAGGAATIVGGAELIPLVEKNQIKFDHCLSTMEFLPKIKTLNRVLKSKMPNKRRGTATNNLLKALEKFRSGETYSGDNFGNLRQTVARTDFTNEEVFGNIKAVLSAVDSHRHKKVIQKDFFKTASLIIPPGPKLDYNLQGELSSYFVE